MSSPRGNGSDSTNMAEHVMSEVHLGSPPGFSGYYISRFTFSIPSGAKICLEETMEHTSRVHSVTLDDDGDLVLSRRCRRGLQVPNSILTIQHKITSSIPSVGLQVWRAELLLADFLLHKIFTSSEFDGVVAIELGAGTGLAGILLALGAETVFLTDFGEEILENCSKNVRLNSGLFKDQNPVHVRELDWRSSWPPSIACDDFLHKTYFWISSDINKIQKVSLLLAADVIYDDDLTDALFDLLEKIMSHGLDKVLYLALDKRYNFSLDDLDIAANGYVRFRSYLREDDGGEDDDIHGTRFSRFVGKKIDVLQVPQHVNQYDRGNDVELWQIKYNRFSESST